MALREGWEQELTEDVRALLKRIAEEPTDDERHIVADSLGTVAMAITGSDRT